VEGYQTIRSKWRKLVEEKKSDPIGGSQWNTLDGNYEKFIRPLTYRPACALYLQRSVDGRAPRIETTKATTTPVVAFANGAKTEIKREIRRDPQIGDLPAFRFFLVGKICKPLREIIAARQEQPTLLQIQKILLQFWMAIFVAICSAESF
jgi:hypothetical protein